MITHANKTRENRSQSVSGADPQLKSVGESAFAFEDNRPEAFVQRKLQEMANNSPRIAQLRSFQDMADNGSKSKQAVQLVRNDQVIQEISLEPKSYNYSDPSEGLKLEREQKERSKEETEARHGSFKPESVDQDPIEPSAVIHAVLVAPSTVQGEERAEVSAVSDTEQPIQQQEIWIDEKTRKPLTGSFDFIILPEKKMDGHLFLLSEEYVDQKKKEKMAVGHTSLSSAVRQSKNPEELDVTYAGMIVFSMGSVIEWNGMSGHYKPPDLISTNKDEHGIKIPEGKEGNGDFTQPAVQSGKLISLPMNRFVRGTFEDIPDDILVKKFTDIAFQQFFGVGDISKENFKKSIEGPPLYLMASAKIYEEVMGGYKAELSQDVRKNALGLVRILLSTYKKYKDIPGLIDGQALKRAQKKK